MTHLHAPAHLHSPYKLHVSADLRTYFHTLTHFYTSVITHTAHLHALTYIWSTSISIIYIYNTVIPALYLHTLILYSALHTSVNLHIHCVCMHPITYMCTFLHRNHLHIQHIYAARLFACMRHSYTATCLYTTCSYICQLISIRDTFTRQITYMCTCIYIYVHRIISHTRLHTLMHWKHLS